LPSAGKKRGAYNGAGHDESPESGHGVLAESLEHAHVVLEVLGLDGILLQVGVAGLLIDVGVLDGGVVPLHLGGARLFDVAAHGCG
jgi:hypothetical protein